MIEALPFGIWFLTVLIAEFDRCIFCHSLYQKQAADVVCYSATISACEMLGRTQCFKDYSGILERQCCHHMITDEVLLVCFGTSCLTLSSTCAQERNSVVESSGDSARDASQAPGNHHGFVGTKEYFDWHTHVPSCAQRRTYLYAFWIILVCFCLSL